MMGEDGSDVFLSDPGVTLRREDRSAKGWSNWTRKVFVANSSYLVDDWGKAHLIRGATPEREARGSKNPPICVDATDRIHRLVIR